MSTDPTPAIAHATALYALWERHDGSLRQQLGDAIADYLRRNPTAREQFYTALRLLRAVREPHRAPDGSPLSTEELRLAHTLR